MITLEKLRLIKEMITLLVVCFDHNYLKNYYKIIAKDLSKTSN